MRTVDLFAGCGGLSLGFQNAGFEIVAAYDNWVPAINVYRNNFSHPIHEVDLENTSIVSSIRNLQCELIMGGPPCQDFSSAGKRDETLGRADLTLSFAQIIVQTRPQYFLMENVERIQQSKFLQNVKTITSEAGYGLTEIVLKASLCGVPQDRKRYFLIGELNGKDGALSRHLKKNQAQNPLTVYDYLGDSLGIEYYYRHPRSYARRAIFSIYEPSPTVRGVNRPIPKTYVLHPRDAIQDLSKVRSLTSIERSYIQTFPRDFVFKGVKIDLDQMIGNAVPVKLGEYVANCLLDYIDHKSEETPQETLTQLKLL